jgi:predicted PurR-regulated permease PerM
MSDRTNESWRTAVAVSPRLATVFLVLGSLFFGVAVAGQILAFAGGFSSILLVVFLTWLLSFLVGQAADAIGRRARIGRGKAIALVYAGVVTLVGLLVIAIVQVGARDAADILRRSDEVTTRIHGILVGIQASVGLSVGTLDLAGTFDTGQRALFATITASLNHEVQAIAGTTFAVVGSLFLIVILSLYAVVDARAILDTLSRVVPNRYADELALVERSVGRAFSGFLRIQVVLVAVQVVLTLVVGLAFGLPYLFLVTVAVGLAMFIPFFGPPLALLPPLLDAIAFRPEIAIPVVVILLVVQTVLVNVIQPRLMRESAGLHPILVLVALLVGAQVAGLWGALFGIPFVAVLNLLVRYIVNRRAVNEVEGIDLGDAVAEIQAAAPGIALDEAVAIAADQAEAITAEASATETSATETSATETSATETSAAHEAEALRAAQGDVTPP